VTEHSRASTDQLPEGSATEPLLLVENVSATFSIKGSRGHGSRRGEFTAVRDVSFELERGSTLGLVGESGSGKSTLARLILGLTPLKSGRVKISDEGAGAGRGHSTMQAIFQDSSGALDPRMRVIDSVAEPLRRRMSKPRATEQAAHWLSEVGLPEWHRRKYPQQLSGGQRQRVSIARAIAPLPALLIADEPLSALDVSLQAQLMQLLARLRDELSLTMIFVSHDLGIVRHITDYVGVMYLGEMVEYGRTEDVFANPRHPYTRALLDSIPDPDSDVANRFYLEGDSPSVLNPPSGCVFHTRCPVKQPTCAEVSPTAVEFQDGAQWAKCLFPLEPARG
jgi:oligopeptide/dipeptide ABC transporter ATP-binding protein